MVQVTVDASPTVCVPEGLAVKANTPCTATGLETLSVAGWVGVPPSPSASVTFTRTLLPIAAARGVQL